MLASALHVAAVLAIAAQTLGPGDHFRSIDVDSAARTYWVHVPPKYDPQKPTPVVFFLHGLGMNGRMMHSFGVVRKADQAGFIAVCPDGTNFAGFVTVWNCGGLQIDESVKPNDIGFFTKLLDELPKTLNVDAKRIYVAGLSNGGMMAHRLGVELSDRIAAIATVAGTLAIDTCEPKRPVPVLLFHGTDDPLVPYSGPPRDQLVEALVFKSVGDTLDAWQKADGCPREPKVEDLPDKTEEGLRVVRKTFSPGKNGAEVVFYKIEGGGHTWPGVDIKLPFLGKTCMGLSATDLIWDFFEKHPMP
jgi:polyhydroxybutyrate depolymerase